MIGAVTGAGASAAGLSGVAKVAKNTFKDAYALPGMTTEGLAGLGKDVVQGHLGNAFKMLVDPYAQLALHPVSTFADNPLNTALLFRGPEAATGGIAGSLLRKGTFGEKAAEGASRVREPLSIGTVGGVPSPIKEARDFTGNLFEKALQTARERSQTAKGLNPNIAREAPKILGGSTPGRIGEFAQNSLNVGMHAKLNRIADEMTGIRQMVGRASRQRVTASLRKAAKDIPGPKEALPVVAHILQGVVRDPERAEADIRKEIGRLDENRPGGRTAADSGNRAQVRDLDTALKTPGAVDRAFKIAQMIRPVFPQKRWTLILGRKGLFWTL